MSSPLRILPITIMMLGLLAAPAFAVFKPLRLFEIDVCRFVQDDMGKFWGQQGMLSSLATFEITRVTEVPSTVTIPADVLNRFVISADNWRAYGNLGPEAVANFVATEDETPIVIGFRDYYGISVSENARVDLGDAVNLSTRGHVGTPGQPLIGGVVIENQHRTVLIRGVGPGLAQFGVTDPVADPYIIVYEHGSAAWQLFNDDWGQRYDADQIELVSQRVGAFPLARGSKDAAYLVELAPGAYTIHVATDGTPGTGLVEIYVVP